MKKGMVTGVLSLLGASAVYLAGVYYSGNQANQYLEQTVEQMKLQTQGQGTISLESKKGLFSSNYNLLYTFTELPPDIENWLGGKQIPFDLKIQHGFLSANSNLTLTQGVLTDKLKTYQENQQQPPFLLVADQKFNPFSQQLSAQANLATDSFLISENNQTVANIGALQMSLEQQGRDLSIAFEIADSMLKTPKLSLEVTGISGTESGRLDHDDPMQAVMFESMSAVVDIKNIHIEDQQFKSDIDALSVNVQQSIEESRLITTVGYQAEAIKAHPTNKNPLLLNKPILKLTIDVDYLATRELTIQLQQMEHTPEAAEQQMENMIALSDNITGKGIGLDLDELAVSWNGEKAYGNAELDLAPFSVPAIMENPMLIQQKVTLEAQLRVPAKMLEMVPGYNPQDIEAMLGMGFIKKQDDDYLTELQIKDGAITLNGNLMPM